MYPDVVVSLILYSSLPRPWEVSWGPCIMFLFLCSPGTITLIDSGDNVETSSYILCNCLNHRVSVRVRFESHHDQMLQTCAHLSSFTNTITWQSSLSNTDGVFLRGEKGQDSAANVGGGFVVRVNTVLDAMTWNLHAHGRQFMYAPISLMHIKLV